MEVSIPRRFTSRPTGVAPVSRHRVFPYSLPRWRPSGSRGSLLLCRFLSRGLIRRFLAMVLNNAPRRCARYRMMAYDVSCDAADCGSLYASLCIS